jgi:hypothetical protein
MEVAVVTSRASAARRPGAGALTVLGAWFALALLANVAGLFRTGPTDPPLALLASIVGPPAAFLAAYALSTAFRAYVLALDLRLLTALQAWRVAGGVFVVLHAEGLLPGLFAYPAGYGDLLVGSLAPFALMSLLRGDPDWRRRVLLLNILGLVDFAGAVGTGLLASEGPLGLLQGSISTAPLGRLPLALIPSFFVPAWTIIHFAALLQLRRSETMRTSPATAGAAG